MADFASNAIDNIRLYQVCSACAFFFPSHRAKRSTRDGTYFKSPLNHTASLSQVLNVARTDATPEDIKRAYRKAAARVHPDRNRDDPDATTKFQEVQYAYSVLSDPRLRSI